MKSLFTSLTERNRKARKQRAAIDSRVAINITEHQGQLWVSSYGEPVVPLSLMAVDTTHLSEALDKCRKGWMNWKFGEGVQS